MQGLLQDLLQLKELQELKNALSAGEGPVTVTGLGPVHRVQAAAALRFGIITP